MNNINWNDVETQWLTYFNTHNLNTHETIRLYMMTQKMNNKGQPIAFTDKSVINGFNQLKSKINQNPDYGYALSASVFDANSSTRGINALVRTKSIMFDLDCYKHNNNPRRIDKVEVFNLPTYIQNLHVFILEHKLREVFDNAQLGKLLPVKKAVTGKGLLFVYQFDKFVNKDKAKEIAEAFKQSLGDDKEIFIPCPITKNQNVFYKIDKTGFDVSHAQRIIGIPRNKEYNYFTPYFVEDSPNSANNPNIPKLDNILNNDYETMVQTYSKVTNSIDKIKTDDIMIQSKIMKVKNKFQRKWNEIDDVDKSIADEIYKKNIKPFDILTKVLNIEPHTITDTYTTFLDPLRGEKHASVSMWHDGKIILINNFVQQEIHGVVSYIRHVKKTLVNENYTNSMAIDDILEYFPSLGNSVAMKTVFAKTKKDSNIELLIDKIKSEERFIYYINANKKSQCYRLDVETGEKTQYDGEKVLITSLLKNKFGIINLGEQYKSFAERFNNEVLHLVHEIFEPDNDIIFTRNDVKYINRWIPTTTYRKVKNKLREDMCEISINQAVEMLKKITPTIWIYINQITQEGDLRWFLSWLGETAKFNLVASIPTVYGVFGGGKDLFLETIFKPFFGDTQIDSFNASRLTSNFNSNLADKTVIAINEGDLNGSNDTYEVIKSISGASSLSIEYKGVDVKNEQRYFNLMIFNNNDIPIVHEASDRRISYFRQTVPLLKTIDYFGLDFNTFKYKLDKEIVDFWHIMRKTKYDQSLPFNSIHDRLYYKQILKMHPLGILLISLVEDGIRDLAMSVLEKETNTSEYVATEKIFKTIHDDFEADSLIKLFNLNQLTHVLKKEQKLYRNALPTSMFIKLNELHLKGVNTKLDPEKGQIIIIDKDKLRKSISTTNNLDMEFGKTDDIKPSTHNFNQFEQTDNNLKKWD